VKKAIPSTRVLLALTAKDLEKYDIYPFLVLSTGLLDHQEPRRYGLAHFSRIAHPTIKLGWAVGLFEEKPPATAVTAFLRQTLDSKARAHELSLMLGPGFGDFREAVIKASEAGKLMKVELVRRHSVRAFPDYSKGYTSATYVFAPGPLACAVRPFQQ